VWVDLNKGSQWVFSVIAFMLHAGLRFLMQQINCLLSASAGALFCRKTKVSRAEL